MMGIVKVTVLLFGLLTFMNGSSVSARAQHAASTPTWTASRFWTWFKSNEGQKLIRLVEAKDHNTSYQAALEFGQIFHRVNPELSWEVHVNK